MNDSDIGRFSTDVGQKQLMPKKEEPASQYISTELWEKVCLFSLITKGTNLSGAVMDCSISCGCCLNLAMSALNGWVFGNRLAPQAAFRETPYRFFLQGLCNWFILISQSEKNTEGKKTGVDQVIFRGEQSQTVGQIKISVWNSKKLLFKCCWGGVLF